MVHHVTDPNDTGAARAGSGPQILLAGAPTGCWTNLGDEAILTGMTMALRAAVPDAELIVVTSSPEGYLAPHDCGEVRYDDLVALEAAVAHADLVLIGGGSIFFDYWGCDPTSVLTPGHQGLTLWASIALLAAAHDTPLMIYGVGVGPLHTSSGRLLTAAVLDVADVVSVRDTASLSTALALMVRGAEIFASGDPALMAPLPEVEPPGGPRPVVGVALRPWDLGVDPDRWMAETAAALDVFVDNTGGSAVFVPCHRRVDWPLSDDGAAAEGVRERMQQRERTELIDVALPWADRAGRLATCDLVLAMRYHAALFGLAAGVPVVAMSYDPKVGGLLDDWAVADLCLDIAAVDERDLGARLTRALVDHQDRRSALAERGRALRAREQLGARAVATLLSTERTPRSIPSSVRDLLDQMPSSADRPVGTADTLRRFRRRAAGVPALPTAAPRRRPDKAADRAATVAILTNRLLDRDSGEPCIGGAERYALELGRLFRDVGLQPTFFQRDGEWGEGDFFGFDVVALPRGGFYSEFEVGVAEAFFERSQSFDHVVYLMANFASGLLRDDAIVVSHGVWWDHDAWDHLSIRTPEWYEHLERVFTRARRVVSVDQNTIDVVRAIFPDAAGAMTCIPNAVDTGQFRPPAERTGDVPEILFPRRADVIRGPQLVAPILRRLPDPCRVRWIGDGDPRLLEELRDTAAHDGRLSVETATFDEMPDRYRDADICVIPTIGSEGQSLACLEAMASGCAVVATRVGGLPELITDDVDGLLCDPDPASLSAAIARLVRDPALRRRLGDRARKSAERHSLRRWRHAWATELVAQGWVDRSTAADPYDIVCFPIVDWEFRWQRPQQLMSKWAERGRRVFYLRVSEFLAPGGDSHAVEQLSENVWEVRLAVPELFSPHQGQVPTGFVEAAIEGLGDLRTSQGITSAVGVAQVAGWAPLSLAARDRFSWPLLYDCMDDWSTFPGFVDDAAFQSLEHDLVDRADVVVASSRTIQERWETKRPDVLLARNAVDFDYFERPVGGGLPEGIEGPVAGFYGSMVEWFDVDLMEHVARARPDVTFVLVGPVRRIDVDALEALENVRFEGLQPYETMPRYLRRFDVCLVPFEVSPVTNGMDVVKFYEYISQGKPVVATKIRELIPYSDLALLADDADDFVTKLDAALAEDDPELVERRRSMARQNTWDERLDRIEHAIRTGRSGDLGGRTSELAAVEQDRDSTSEVASLRARLDAIERSRAVGVARLYWRAQAMVRGTLTRPGSRRQQS